MNKECLECGFTGDIGSFKEGCPECGNWDSWRIKSIGEHDCPHCDTRGGGKENGRGENNG